MKFTPLLILLLAGCMSQQKAYRIVAADPFRSNAELTQLAKIAEIEFPFKPTATIIDTVIDSTAYNKFLLKGNDVIDDPNESRKPCNPCGTPTFTINGVTHILNGRELFPPPIIKTITKTVQVEDEAGKQVIQGELNNCRQENDNQAATIATLESKVKELDKTKWLLIGILSLIGIGGITTTVLKLKKII